MENQRLGGVKRTELCLDYLLVKGNGEVVSAEQGSNVDAASERETSLEEMTARLAGDVRRLGLAENPFDDHIGRLELPGDPFTDDAEF